MAHGSLHLQLFNVFGKYACRMITHAILCYASKATYFPYAVIIFGCFSHRALILH